MQYYLKDKKRIVEKKKRIVKGIKAGSGGRGYTRTLAKMVGIDF